MKKITTDVIGRYKDENNWYVAFNENMAGENFLFYLDDSDNMDFEKALEIARNMKQQIAGGKKSETGKDLGECKELSETN